MKNVLASLALPAIAVIAFPSLVGFWPALGAVAAPAALRAVDEVDACFAACMSAFVAFCLATSLALRAFERRRF